MSTVFVPLNQKLTNWGPWVILVLFCYVLLQIKLFWNTDTPICLCILVCGCFDAIMAQLQQTLYNPQSLKYLLSVPLHKKFANPFSNSTKPIFWNSASPCGPALAFLILVSLIWECFSRKNTERV